MMQKDTVNGIHRGNLNVIGQMKQVILQALLTDEEIMKLILDRPDVELPAFSARYKEVVPWRRVPDTQMDAKTSVAFDITMGKAITSAAKEFTLYIWIMSHDSVMPFGNKEGNRLQIEDRGVRNDILADKIDYLINGSTELGFTKAELIRSELFEPVDGYSGRSMVYSITGWNRYNEQLYRDWGDKD